MKYFLSLTASIPFLGHSYPCSFLPLFISPSDICPHGHPIHPPSPSAAHETFLNSQLRANSSHLPCQDALLCPIFVCMLRRFSCGRFSAIPWTVACQDPLSMGFFKQEYWRGLPCPPPGDLPDPGVEPAPPVTPALQADCLLLSHQGSLEHTSCFLPNYSSRIEPWRYSSL